MTPSPSPSQPPEPPYRSVWQDLSRTPFEQGFLKANGVATRYWRVDAASEVDVIFLHGTGGHVEGFARNIGAFGLAYRSWAIDLVGHGWSDLSDHDLEIDDYVEHLLHFIRTAGINRAILVGVSLGGWVASRFAGRHPELVAGLVLITPGGSQSDRAVMSTIQKTTSAAVGQLSWDTVRARLEYLVHDPAQIPDDLVATRMAIYGRPGMTENMAHVLVLQRPEVRARNILDADTYGRITAPTLVVWTEHDPTAPVSEGRRLAGMIPGAEFVVLADCAHWPQFEAPERFNALALDFLSRAIDPQVENDSVN